MGTMLGLEGLAILAVAVLLISANWRTLTIDPQEDSA
jgi:hypothetical protein